MATSTPTAPSTTSPNDTPDPTATYVNTSTLDFLLIELVPMAYRITADLALREEDWVHGTSTSTSSSRHNNTTDNDATSTVGVSGGGGGGGLGGGGGTGVGTVDEEEAREAVFHRLETLGYRVGLGIVERVSRQTPRPHDPLSTIKFLCKDLWTLLFRKQIDNLKTNHRGIYVLTDNTFKPLTRMSFDTKKYTDAQYNAIAASAAASAAATGGEGVSGSGGGLDPGLGRDANTIARAQPFLYFPAGVVRGCLAGLGVQATVTAETSGIPAATFQIRTQGAKA
ncbi:transport protein particle component [Lentithecium fluviatile CBS 122367]|uniref:Transport protein particle component n=1 Tax=Lentithecium fluviatile CBS 122367 TaxID=1168545 RepID=A0A6G1ILB5_9PLEO|nr:transport protein particle component [Lentithecium fluviatile CBS 122367]